jgi:O-antigen ligase
MRLMQQRLLSSMPLAPAIIAALMLAAIPFRVTVDKRGGILALLVIVLVVIASRHGDWREFFPRMRALQVAGVIWIGVVCVSAVTGPDPFEAFRGVRSDVLGPILAFCAMYYLTRSREDLFVWAVVCAVAQLVLAVLLVADPYQPDPAHRPAYVDVGVASCWLVVSAAWLPVLWNAAGRDRRWPRWLTVAFAVAFAISLVVAALASLNRVVWICFAIMLVTGAAVWWRARGSKVHKVNSRPVWRPLIGTAIAVGLLAIFAWQAIGLRAPSYNASAEQSPSYVRQDPRMWIWPAAINQIAQKPVSGFGFGSEHWKDEFVRQNGSTPDAQRMNHAHNTILNYTLQAGVAGGAAILFLFVALFMSFTRFTSIEQRSELTWLIASCGAALVAGFFLRNLTDDYFLRQPLHLFTAVAGAFLGALERQAGLGNAHMPRAPAP